MKKDFCSDKEKMIDFNNLSKEEFLESYSYITEEEYEETKNVCGSFEVKEITQVKTKEEARQYAIEWQEWAIKTPMSYGELAEWQLIFTELIDRFDLKKEFEENGII